MMLSEIEIHGRRSAWLCTRLCAHLGLPRNQIQDFARAAQTHDIGKNGLPEALLSKPTALSAVERWQIEQHCAIGASLLLLDARSSGIETSTAAVAVALSHHEWWNGCGYPFGLSGDSIPRCARIVSVVDVFDALLSVRPYKSAWSLSDATGYIAQRRGTQFDPECVDAMVRVAGELPPAWGALAQSWSIEPQSVDQGELESLPAISQDCLGC